MRMRDETTDETHMRTFATNVVFIYQRSGMNWKVGGLAQLVERVLSMHEVVSSILTFSIFVLAHGGVSAQVAAAERL